MDIFFSSTDGNNWHHSMCFLDSPGCGDIDGQVRCDWGTDSAGLHSGVCLTTQLCSPSSVLYVENDDIVTKAGAGTEVSSQVETAAAGSKDIKFKVDLVV